MQYRDAEGARGMHEVGGRFQYPENFDAPMTSLLTTLEKLKVAAS